MPTYRVDATLYIDADDPDDARQIAKGFLTDFIKAVNVTNIVMIDQPRRRGVLTKRDLTQLWHRPTYGDVR